MGRNSRWRWSFRRRVCPTSTDALGRILDSAEDASPLEAVEAVTAELSAALEASAAFFMIADISGRGLVRLSQSSADPAGVRAELGGPGDRPRLDDDEQAVDLPITTAASPGRRCAPRPCRSCPPETGVGTARANGGWCWRR